jgi:serine/threonine protein kinase
VETASFHSTDARVRHFADALAAGKPIGFEEALPSADHPFFLPVLEELAAVQIEHTWRMRTPTDTQRPTPEADPGLVEYYLQRYPQLHEPEIVQRLLEREAQARNQFGDKPGPVDPTRRFPDLFSDSKILRVELQPSLAETIAGLDKLPPGPDLPLVRGYEVLKLLGRGGNGAVYLARQAGLNRLVALKMILTPVGGDSDDWARFRREAETIARLHHPNIIQIYEIGTADNRLYFSLEYADAGSLAEKLTGDPQAVRPAAELIRTLANAVDLAHQLGIIHRDLKPGNILMVSDDRSEGRLHLSPLTAHQPKIADFGLAKELGSTDAKTQTGVIMGTPSYMAPEQADSLPKKMGPHTDGWALGAILYELLTGRPPFRGETPWETLDQVRKQEPVPPRRLQPKVPLDLETICLKSLQKDPRRRYSSAKELAADLDRFLNGETIHARPVSLWEKAWRWSRRNPYQAGLLATLTFSVLAAIIGLFFWQQADYRRRNRIQSLQNEQERERIRSREELRRDVEVNVQLGLTELRAGRFDNAEQLLTKALLKLKDHNDLDDLRGSLEEKQKQAHRLLEFQKLSDEAERSAFVENDDNARQKCEDGLKALGVLTAGERWWESLPAGSLTTEQVHELQVASAHQLLLLSALRIKDSLSQPPAEAKQSCRSAQQTLALTKAYYREQKLPTCVTAQLLADYCYLQLLELDKIERIPKGALPASASDYYFMAFAAVWVELENDTISKLLRTFSPLVGLDFKQFPADSIWLFRQAVIGNPHHYWSYYWLGRQLANKDLRAAELAFDQCVLLRPEQPWGYAERAHVLARQARDAPEPLKSEVAKQARLDAETALKLDPHNFYINLRCFAVYTWLADQQAVRREALQFLALSEPPKTNLSTRVDDYQPALEQVRQYLLKLQAAQPAADSELRILLALADLLTGHDADAEGLANALLQEKSTIPDDIRANALYVRGDLELQRNQLTDAFADFEKARNLNSGNRLALWGKLKALEAQQKWDQLLYESHDLLDQAVTDWQRIEAHRFRGRAELGLGRTDEVRQALGKIRELNAKLAQRWEAEWFPKQ